MSFDPNKYTHTELDLSQQANHSLYRAVRKVAAVVAIAATANLPIASAIGQTEPRAGGSDITEIAPEHMVNQGPLSVSMPKAEAASDTDAVTDTETNLQTLEAIKGAIYRRTKSDHNVERKTDHTARHKKEKIRKIPSPSEKNTNPLIPPAVFSQMTENATYIPMIGCSGWTLRNQAGLAVGELTAKHCLVYFSGNLDRNTTKQQQLDDYYPIIAYNGSTFGNKHYKSNMVPVGTITSFYTSTANTNDLAVGIFKGENKQAVVNIAEHTLMPASQSSTLSEGTTIFNRGMPSYQPKNNRGAEMQNFAMSLLGPTVASAENESDGIVETVNVDVAAVSLTPDGSECTPGESGSVASALEPSGQLEPIGVATTGEDWGYYSEADNPSQGQASLSYFESIFNTDLSSYVGVCEFSDQLPTPGEATTQFVPVKVFPATTVQVVKILPYKSKGSPKHKKKLH